MLSELFPLNSLEPNSININIFLKQHTEGVAEKHLKGKIFNLKKNLSDMTDFLSFPLLLGITLQSSEILIPDRDHLQYLKLKCTVIPLLAEKIILSLSEFSDTFLTGFLGRSLLSI